MDAISGTIVSQDQARNDILSGCRMGDRGVKEIYASWLSLIPEESKAIVESIEISLHEATQSNDEKSAGIADSFLVRKKPEAKNESGVFDPSDRIKHHFAALVAQGKRPTAAAAEAIQLVAEEQSGRLPVPRLDFGQLNDVSWQKLISLEGVVVPNFQWTDDCWVFSDSRQSTSLVELRGICSRSSSSTGIIIGVQSLYGDGVKGPQYYSVPLEEEEEWLECILESNNRSLIEIGGEIRPNGISQVVLRSANSRVLLKDHNNDREDESSMPFSLDVPEGLVVVGLHGVAASTGIVSFGIVCGQNNPAALNVAMLELSPDELNPVLECARRVSQRSGNDKQVVLNFLSTAKKYVENAMRQPFNPKFRTFKLNNKVSDRMAQVPGGIDLLLALQFSIFHASSEYLVCLSPDVDRMEKSINSVFELLGDYLGCVA